MSAILSQLESLPLTTTTCALLFNSLSLQKKTKKKQKTRIDPYLGLTTTKKKKKKMPSADPILSVPKTQTAIVAEGLGRVSIKHDAPVPFLGPDMAIVRTVAVAINPTDAKMLDYSATTGAIHGNDFAGTVVALGEDALNSSRLSIGDRVCGFVHGANKLRPDVGGFAQYVGATADLLLKIPDNMTFEEAASLGVGVGTATMALWLQLQIPASLDDLRTARGNNSHGQNTGAFALVAGGSTATGTRAIQLLKRYVKSRCP